MIRLDSDKPVHFCDGLTRRDFLHVGMLGMMGFALTDWMTLKAEGAVIQDNDLNVIQLFLVGGPSQLDTWDMKPDAPAEIRGPYKPIKTNVPGIEICEHLPRMAKMMDKLVPIRSVVGAVDEHSDFQCLTGRLSRNQPPGGWPAFGSVVSKLLGPKEGAVPPYLGLEPKMQHKPYTGDAHEQMR